MNKKLNEYKRKLTVKGIASRKPVDIEAWKNFLDSLPKDKDPYTLSTNKYKCRMYYFDWKYKLFVNFISFFELFFIHVSNFCYKVRKQEDKENKLNRDIENIDMLILKREVDIKDVFPNELYEEFPKNKVLELTHDSTIMTDKDFKYAYKNLAKKNFFRFEYKLLALKELALHSKILASYNPKAIVVYINERNTISPILKELYKSKNIEFISFMHGVDLLHLIKAYMSFSRYYVWDEDYIDMYIKDMSCAIDRYIHYTPEKLNKNYKLKEKYEKKITYYVSAMSEQAVENLVKIVEELNNKNISILVRLHPRMSNLEHVKSLFNEKNIESFDIKIDDSIENTEYIVGTSTTVLTEAYYGGKPIIIDDMTDKTAFNNLSDRKYLLFKKEHTLFSEYLKNEGISLEF